MDQNTISDLLIVTVPIDIALACATAYILHMKGRDFGREAIRYFLSYLFGTPFLALILIPRAALRRPMLATIAARTVSAPSGFTCKACGKPIRATTRICPHCQTLLWR